MAYVKTLAQHISAELARLARCDSANPAHSDVMADAGARLASLARNYLPSGSGFDGATQIADRSTSAKIVLVTAFHHMNESGMYDGWTEHQVTILPAFDGFDISISGRNRNGIKDYIAEIFDHALRQRLESTFDHMTKEISYAIAV